LSGGDGTVKKRVRIVLVVLAGLVVVLVIVGLMIPRLIDMAWARDLMVKQAQAVLGRDVQLGSAQLRLIPNIRVQLAGLEVAQAAGFGDQPFVKVDEVYVNVKLVPLLRKQVVVDRLVLEEPAISVVRSEDGTFSFNDLVDREPANAEAAGPDKVPSTGDSGAPRVRIGGIQVRHGKLTFLDKQTAPHTTIKVDDLVAKVRNLVPGEPVEFDISADALGGSFSLRGSIRPTPPLERIRADVDATLEHINLELLKPYVKQVQSNSISGKFTASLDDEKQAARWQGTVSMENGLVSVPGRADASVKGTTLSVDGSGSARYDLKEASFDGKILAQGLNLVGLHPSVPKAEIGKFEFDGDGLLAAGSTAIDVEGKATVSKLRVTTGIEGSQWDVAAETVFVDLSGDFRFGEQKTAGKATVTVRVEQPRANAPSGDAYALSTVRLDNATSVLGDAELSFDLPEVVLGGTELRGSGTLALPRPAGSGESGALGYDARVDCDKLSLDELAALVPALSGYSPSGNLALSVAAKGRAGQAPSELTCKAEFKKVGFSHPKVSTPIQNVVGTADVSLSTEKEFAKVTGLAFSVAGTRCEIDADLDGVRVPSGTFSVNLDNVDVERLLPPKPAEPAPTKPSRRPERPRKSSKSPLKEARVQGAITVGSGKYKTVTFGNTNVTVSLKDGALEVRDVSSDLCDGKMSGSIEIASLVEQPALAGKVGVQGVDIEPLLALSERAKGMVEGNVSGRFTFDAARLDPTLLLNTLKLEGDATIPRGQFTGFDLARKLGDISQLAGVSEIGPENTVFRDLTAEFALADATAKVSSMRMAVEHFDVRCSGTYRLDKSLNMRAEAVVSEELSAKNRGSDVQTFFENEDRRIVVPFTATGTVPRVKVMLDMRRLSERALDRGKERLKEELVEEIVGKRKPGEKEKPEERIIREIGGALLDGILKR
jgi:AsmA protein